MEAPFNGPNNNQKARKDCVMDIRNHHKPVKFMVKFLHNVLHVYADLNDGGGYGSCLAVQVDQDLTGYHMAFTAQTGGASDLVEIKEISARYLDEADADEDDLSTTIEDYNSSKAGVDASMSGFFVFLLQLALIGLPIYKAQLISKSRLDEILLSKQLNGLGLAHLVVHGVSTLTLLLCGYLFIFFLALLQTVWFVLLVVKQKWKFTPPLRNTYAAGMSPLQRTYVTAGLQSIQFLMMLLSLLFF
jgi:hypothetical protein